MSSKSVASFYKTIDGKYSLQSFDLGARSNIYYNNQTFKIEFRNTFFLLKEYAKKRSGRNNRINLSKPIYLSTPQKDEVSSGVKSILLSQKEIEFVND